MTVRIEIIDDDSGVVRQSVVTGSYLVAWEEDGAVRTVGNVSIETALRYAGPNLLGMAASFFKKGRT